MSPGVSGFSVRLPAFAQSLDRLTARTAVKLENLENIVLGLGKPPAVPPPTLNNFAAPRL
jgi:hypothetical protein